MQIKLEHLTKRFGDTVAVNDLGREYEPLYLRPDE